MTEEQRERKRMYMKQWRKNNPESVKTSRDKFRDANPDYWKAYDEKYHKTEEYRQYISEYNKRDYVKQRVAAHKRERYQTDEEYRKRIIEYQKLDHVKDKRKEWEKGEARVNYKKDWYQVKKVENREYYEQASKRAKYINRLKRIEKLKEQIAELELQLTELTKP